MTSEQRSGGVVIVTDSSTCLPRQLTASLPIRVLPISVYLPEPEAAERTGETAWPLSEAVEDAERDGANHPFVTEYLAAIEAGEASAVVVVTPAIEFAAMYRNAALAAELATRPCATVDARTGAGGQALVVLAGAEAAAAGADLETVVQVIEDASRRVEVMAALATLEPIRRSGPVPEEVLGELAEATERSLFRIRDGVIEPLGSLGDDEALQAIVSAVDASSPAGIERCTVFHAGAPELAERLGSLIDRVDFVSGFSVAMQIHTGRGVVGAAWVPCVSEPERLPDEPQG